MIALKLHPDKQGEKMWERETAWYFVQAWHSMELYKAQKRVFMELNGLPTWAD